jgi:hypothetical protein
MNARLSSAQFEEDFQGIGGLLARRSSPLRKLYTTQRDIL